MSLELYIWGPAFGLPSIDAECLAAVAYLALASTADEWRLITTSPSALPYPLPALRDARTGRWVAAGFDAIVRTLREGRWATAAGIADLDDGLLPAQVADRTAFSAFLRAEAAPLLALSLYVSSANWAATTRPAYSAILPFPLTWIEPPAVRAAHAASAVHLGLSSLDTDSDDNSAAGHPRSAARASAAAVHVFPNQQTATTPGAFSSITRALTPEAKSQIRLDEAARACFAALAQLKGRKRLFLRPETTHGSSGDGGHGVLRPSSLDCLAFGYLALVTVPKVPRSFLRHALARHHPELADFVADMRRLCRLDTRSGTNVSGSPPASSTPSAGPAVALACGLNPLWLRAAHGIVYSVPGLSGSWLAWLWRLVRGLDGEEDGEDGEGGHGNGPDDPQSKMSGRRRRLRRQQFQQRQQRQRFLALGATVSAATLTVALIMGYRRLPAFGTPVTVYRRTAQAGFAGLGAAGALFDGL